jgi:tRNA pseudouridine38-40 synthase
MDPLSRVDRALIYNGELDINKMRECLPQFVGTHDFSSFANRLAHKQAANGGVALDSHRRIRRIELIEEDDRGLDFRLEFELDGALYKMIRNIAGMIHGVGAGEFYSADIPRILAQKNRNLNPARAAPAQGLTLEHVYYKEY